VETYNGNAWDVAVFDSHIHGGEQALKQYNSSNPMHCRFFAWRSKFSAGAADGGANSANPVVCLDAGYSLQAWFDRCLIVNGDSGIFFDNPGQYAYLCMANSAITDQTGYGVRMDPGGTTYGGRVVATNCTFSALGGPCVIWADNGTSTVLDGTFRNCAFAPGGSATNFVSEDANRSLVLSGTNNAFYAYGTFSAAVAGGGVTDNMTGSILAPAANAGLAADGYHLAAGSPLLDKYALAADDPNVDIDGDARPQKKAADIGCDEGVFSPSAPVIVVR
jgi:hypothetical protein